MHKEHDTVFLECGVEVVLIPNGCLTDNILELFDGIDGQLIVEIDIKITVLVNRRETDTSCTNQS